VTSGHASLAVTADLSLATPGGEAVTVVADGAVITVNLPRLWSRQWAPGPLADRGPRQMLLARLHRGMQMADLTVQFKVQRQVVAQLSPQSRPTQLSRLLGVGAVRVNLIPCLRALLRA
jgi:hypothetical protein